MAMTGAERTARYRSRLRSLQAAQPAAAKTGPPGPNAQAVALTVEAIRKVAKVQPNMDAAAVQLALTVARNIDAAESAYLIAQLARVQVVLLHELTGDWPVVPDDGFDELLRTLRTM